MDVERPTVMHIANGSQTRNIVCWTPSTNGVQFYAWSAPEGSTQDRWRVDFRLVGDKLVETNNSQSFRQYNLLSYECLDSIPYKPELKVYFPLLSIAVFCLILAIIYKTIIKRLLP